MTTDAERGTEFSKCEAILGWEVEVAIDFEEGVYYNVAGS